MTFTTYIEISDIQNSLKRESQSWNPVSECHALHYLSKMTKQTDSSDISSFNGALQLLILLGVE